MDNPLVTNYDTIADDYLAHTERADSWNNIYERPYVLSQLHDLKNKNVLDLGCGSGFYTKYALEMGANVTAIDASQVMIDRLSSLIDSPKLSLFCADATKPLTFLQPQSFDCIICALFIHYIKDWGPLLAELYRMMKKGGKLIISTHHPFHDYRYLEKDSYFDNMLVEDTWGHDDLSFKVSYYTRSLTDVLRPIIKSQFDILSMEEPLPDEICRRMDPELYEHRTKRPGLLFIMLGR